ncbi:ribonuclease T2-like [Rhizophlyctis rosea]|nr:ribonuclease T2-like [Rhizophlyctis rosea]
MLNLIAVASAALLGVSSVNAGYVKLPGVPQLDLCPETARGCSNSTFHPTPYFDGCCVPTQGLVVFAQNWTMGYCANSNNTCAQSTINSLPKDAWTIHGLWPDYCDGTFSSDNLGCVHEYGNQETYDVVKKQDKGLFEKMKKVWMGANGDYNWMWSHEFTKHGTCMSTLNPECYGKTFKSYFPILDYFKAAMSLYPRYNLFDILKKGGVVPSSTKTYTIQQFQEAIVRGIGYEASITCAKGDDGRSYLTEIWISTTARPNFKFDTQKPVPSAYVASCNVTAIVYKPQPHSSYL